MMAMRSFVHPEVRACVREWSDGGGRPNHYPMVSAAPRSPASLVYSNSRPQRELIKMSDRSAGVSQVAGLHTLAFTAAIQQIATAPK
uniref:Uncharacterized protein n=1 Tax=Bursaphelenchus xylophilus TaxID=6326 RepID=A0A1I7SDV3_BURXY